MRRVDVHRSHSADITTGLLQRYSLARLKYIRSLIRALRRQAVCDPQTIPQSPSMSSTAVAQEEDSKPAWKIDLALADPLPPPPPGFEGQPSSSGCSPQDLSWQAPALQDLSLTNAFPHPLDLDPPPGFAPTPPLAAILSSAIPGPMLCDTYLNNDSNANDRKCVGDGKFSVEGDSLHQGLSSMTKNPITSQQQGLRETKGANAKKKKVVLLKFG